jgi:hypothetical protein
MFCRGRGRRLAPDGVVFVSGPIGHHDNRLAVASVFCEEVTDAVFERPDDGWVHDAAVAGQ